VCLIFKGCKGTKKRGVLQGFFYLFSTGKKAENKRIMRVLKRNFRDTQKSGIICNKFFPSNLLSLLLTMLK